MAARADLVDVVHTLKQVVFSKGRVVGAIGARRLTGVERHISHRCGDESSAGQRGRGYRI